MKNIACRIFKEQIDVILCLPDVSQIQVYRCADRWIFRLQFQFLQYRQINTELYNQVAKCTLVMIHKKSIRVFFR